MFPHFIVSSLLAGGLAAFGQAPAKPARSTQAPAKPAVTSQAAPACDRLAAHPKDAQKPASVSGVADAAVAAAAIDACALEVRRSPKSARLKFQLGRALWTAKRYDEALEAFLQAEEMDYAPAAYYLGLAHERGLIQGEKADLGAAADLYMIAASEGFAPAVEAYQALEWETTVSFEGYRAANYIRMLYENDFKLVTQPSALREEYVRELMFYMIGMQNFLSLAPNEFEPSCEGAAEAGVSQALQKYASREMHVPENLSGDPQKDAAAVLQQYLQRYQRMSMGEMLKEAERNNRATTAVQFGTDDVYAFAADFGGCKGAPFRQLYSNMRVFVLEKSAALGPKPEANAVSPESESKVRRVK